MCDMCKDHPKFTSYIYDTWLVHKEKFVKAWTNRMKHFGTTTSNRAESAHASLKKMFRNNKGDLCVSWEAVDRLTIVRHNAIEASFERSINIVEHRFKSPICLMKVTHGLPCACALQSLSSIPYAAVDPFWKILSCEQVPVVESQTSKYDEKYSGCMPPEIEALIAHFNSLDDAGQSMLRRKLKELYCPQISSLCPPEVKEQEAKASKRKPRLTKTPKPTIWSSTPKSQALKSKNKKSMKTTGATTNIYLPELPYFLWQYIHEVIDVVGDGNCGYRVVAALLGLENGQDGWVREELIAELTLYRKHYTNMWGYDVVQAMHLRLTLPPGGRVTEDKWMHLPEMGYLIANRFWVVFISISLKSSYTYLPMRGGAPPLEHHVVAVGHVTNHFVQLKLVSGHPMPPIAPQWEYNVVAPESEWCRPYQERLERFMVEHTAWIGPHVPSKNDYIDITKD
ncbi:uncharacterized protein LOC130730984 [Lotus japonicus]|uniref:uncharacterized protein LOC130730984 n=1 Tax=Lotus japonicus TaxID=34305 RepID=UPI0025858938|nr:uncharacterized protein LOC130730984 [Lotus japonicus]